MTDYKPSKKELVDFEERLTRTYRIEKGSIGIEKLKEMWKEEKREKENIKMIKAERLNLIKDIFSDTTEIMQQTILDECYHSKNTTSRFFTMAEIEMQKVKVLEKIADNL
ncbi:hypothetical protein [uncultured Methanobacterium sp.]|uniref:hypothetical protein n=1 Tax=uncultured Methanobacterium sp. TaxID=176306 RepID=UPI002AA802DF|nr:hypothetical protein [uncultured Methanobacterium sp.]